MAQSKSPQKHTPRNPQAVHHRRTAAPPTISGKWLLGAFAVVTVGAAFCAWAVLCLLFWQGSWQLLYHPSANVTRTPANIGLTFSPVSFAVGETGAPQLQGWWIPADPGDARFTVLYLHSQNGNLADTLDELSSLHSAGVNILAFDYRGFGQSVFAHPSEAHWRQDASWALDYLRSTRHIDPHSIVLAGNGLGANLALELATAHPELAGVILKNPVDSPMNVIFNDQRAHMVPAHLLVSDRFDLKSAAPSLRIPSLWIFPESSTTPTGAQETQQALQAVSAPKMRVTLATSSDSKKDFADALKRWLNDLNK